MLVTVIIFLREALEAALILSVLLAVSGQLMIGRSWLLVSLLFGVVGGAITAYFLGDITNLFEGAGQEVLNAGLLIIMTSLNTIICIHLSQYLFNRQRSSLGNVSGWLQIFVLLTAAIAITHEGSELSLYSYAFLQTQTDKMALLLGGTLGIGIGASLGAIVYYIFQALSQKKLLFSAIAILTLISAGMISQAILYLIQAGWLPSRLPLWDTSGLISENSIIGQLLYALIGYEATPDPLQVIFYTGIITINLLLIYLFSTGIFSRKQTNL